MNVEEISTSVSLTNRCSVYKAGKILCGKRSCPLLARIKSYLKIKPMYNRDELEGASPPSLFVGHFGFHVYAGPLVIQAR